MTHGKSRNSLSRIPNIISLAITLLVILWSSTAEAQSQAIQSQAAAAPRPNIVWILSEDSSVDYFQLYGAKHGRTPALNQLAAQGLVFEHAFSCSPVCSVARTTLMSGLLAPRIGSQFHRKQQTVQLPTGCELFPAWLRKAGYYTSNNSKKDYNVIEGKVWDDSSRKASWRNRPTPSTPFFHMHTLTTSHESSLHFSREQMRKSPTTTNPAEVDLAPYQPDTPTMRYTKARYFDRIELIDSQVAELVEQLKDDNLLDHTFIFFFGDHGGVLPRSKGYLYETGLHVPLVVYCPPTFKSLVPFPTDSRVTGFVNFTDFGPTVLRLAQAEGESTMDGKPFLGTDVTRAQVTSRNSTFGYADRFDERIELCRSLRRGNYKYIRNYQPYFPDALQNNYRYQMLAFAEWRELASGNQLPKNAQTFFQPKPVEMLFDLDTDPHEVNNLANNPVLKPTLLEMREELNHRLKTLPDLSFYPESHLIDTAFPKGWDFGNVHRNEIAELIDTADIALLDFDAAAPRLESALQADSTWQRYWACMATATFGPQAVSLTELVRACQNHDSIPVQLQATVCLALIDQQNPWPKLEELAQSSTSPAEVLEILNVVVWCQDHQSWPVPDLTSWKLGANSDEVQRRKDYLHIP